MENSVGFSLLSLTVYPNIDFSVGTVHIGESAISLFRVKVFENGVTVFHSLGLNFAIGEISDDYQDKE